MGQTDDVPGLDVAPLDLVQRDRPVAIGVDPFKMLLHHPGEILVRCQPPPLELLHPAAEEQASLGLGAIAPEMPESLLEEVGLEEPSVGPEELRQGCPGLPPDMSQAGEQEELPEEQPPSRLVPARLNSFFRSVLRASSSCRITWNFSCRRESPPRCSGFRNSGGRPSTCPLRHG